MKNHAILLLTLFLFATTTLANRIPGPERPVHWGLSAMSMPGEAEQWPLDSEDFEAYWDEDDDFSTDDYGQSAEAIRKALAFRDSMRKIMKTHGDASASGNMDNTTGPSRRTTSPQDTASTRHTAESSRNDYAAELEEFDLQLEKARRAAKMGQDILHILNGTETETTNDENHKISPRHEELLRQERAEKQAWILLFCGTLGLLLAGLSVMYVKKRRQRGTKNPELPETPTPSIETPSEASDKTPSETNTPTEVARSPQAAAHTSADNRPDETLLPQVVLRVNGIINGNFKEKISDELWREIERAINTAYPGFDENILRLHPVSQQEMQVSRLIKLGIQPSNIARLIHKSEESVSSIRRRLYLKCFKTEKASPSMWDDFINSL